MTAEATYTQPQCFNIALLLYESFKYCIKPDRLYFYHSHFQTPWRKSNISSVVFILKLQIKRHFGSLKTRKEKVNGSVWVDLYFYWFNVNTSILILPFKIPVWWSQAFDLEQECYKTTLLQSLKHTMITISFWHPVLRKGDLLPTSLTIYYGDSLLATLEFSMSCSSPALKHGQI